ncbi:MAG: hypothetical protein MI725_13545 [Pirellulales bacterium]|nr:hypothetical protein [Pirellulales bacterium]
MKRFALLLVAAALWLGAQSDAAAQIAYVTYYQPATVYSPVVANCAVPRVAYYAPAAPAVAYQPVARYHTRYRPFLGGTVTRVRYGYAPTYAAPAPVLVAY